MTRLAVMPRRCADVRCVILPPRLRRRRGFGRPFPSPPDTSLTAPLPDLASNRTADALQSTTTPAQSTNYCMGDATRWQCLREGHLVYKAYSVSWNLTQRC